MNPQEKQQTHTPADPRKAKTSRGSWHSWPITASGYLKGILLCSVLQSLGLFPQVPPAVHWQDVKGWLNQRLQGTNDVLDPVDHVLRIAPVIDTHIDLPWLLRSIGYQNNVTAVDLEAAVPCHLDIPRLREGHVGGFFWSVYTACPDADTEGDDFLGATWRVRDTLEQIDLARGLMDKYPDTFSFALTADDIRAAFAAGKIASLLGVEGAHQAGNSIAVVRQYYQLGVRYMTLAHFCHNAFADSGGAIEPHPPRHGGLSPFGFKLVDEMNRLGMLVDVSHVSDDTARQALLHSRAPVIWSHSSARAVHDVARNLPDDILRMVGFGDGKKDAVIMVNFVPVFIAPAGEATLARVADHVEHIAKVAGKKHVGMGSDFDGIPDVPEGLEDVSKYPALVAELHRRGWTPDELAGFTSGNFLRVFARSEAVAQELQKSGMQPVYDLYDKRTDIPESVPEGEKVCDSHVHGMALPGKEKVSTGNY